MKRLLCVLPAILMALAAHAETLIGLRPNEEQSHYDIVSIESQTGTISTLIDNAFTDFYGGSFISNPAIGVGYAITDQFTLFQYSLSTGQVLANPSVGFGGALALGTGGNLVGVRYDEEAEESDIVTVDPQTGATSTLISSAFADFYGGSFISNPSLGVGYAITDDFSLLQFNLSTGQILASPSVGFGGDLALGASGSLVGLRYDDEFYDIVTIDPQTGNVSILVDNAFSDFYFGTFGSNPALGIGYVQTDSNILFQFDLSTGAIVGDPVLNSGLKAMTSAAVPEPAPLSFLLFVAAVGLCFFPKRRQVGK